MRSSTSVSTVVLIAILLLAIDVVAQQNARQLYERARMMDESGQTAEAIALYSEVVSQARAQNDRALAAQAQYRVGRLNRRLGRIREAQLAFKTIVTDFPDQTDVARLAQALIVGKVKPSPTLRIKRVGTSVDGQFLATFALPQGETYSAPAFDESRHRLYFVTQRITAARPGENHRHPQRKVLQQIYWPSTIVVIDTRTNIVLKIVSLPVYIVGIVYNPANDRLYASAGTNGHIKVIDPDTFSTVASVRVPGYPGISPASVNPITNKIYVGSQGFAGNDKLFVIDGVTNALSGPFDLEGVAAAVTVNSATNRIYAIADERTRVFRGEDMSVAADLPGMHVVEIDAINNRVYAWTKQRGAGGDLLVLDGNTHTTLARFAYQESGGRVGIDSRDNRVYVPLSSRNQLAAINAITMTEISRIRVARNPSLATAEPSTGKAYAYFDNGAGRPQMLVAAIAKESFNQDSVAEEFLDTFDGPDLNPEWETVKGYGSCSLTENPGALRLRTAALAGSSQYLILMRKFRGDYWVLETSVSYFTGATGGGRDLRLAVSFGAPPFEDENTPEMVIIGRGRDSWNDCCPGTVFTQFIENAVSVQPETSLPLNDTDSYAWRIERRGPTVTVERSDDRINFTVVSAHTFSRRIEGLVQYLSLSFRSHANKDAYADYDFIGLRKSSSAGLKCF